ncbi:hypothetical protein [Streptosporangium sp. NBC_01756]|nr:hypothetical protein [Streptosporangium sp. NBC_01756]WSC88321.1 hypothetical protein OIE48_09090 [Streptosporangium sp. NBC_01756]
MSDQDAPEPTSDEGPGHEAQSEEVTQPVTVVPRLPEGFEPL